MCSGCSVGDVECTVVCEMESMDRRVAWRVVCENGKCGVCAVCGGWAR